ncbi:hypothetical protein V8F20_002982 [Naviculisporaceae sp. PSN 640]
MAPQIQDSQFSSWSSLAGHALLTARQTFPSPSRPDRDSGLHPAAIFGIVAGVMFVIIIAAWIFWFTLIKKALTHRDYGILPSIRNASNGRRHDHGHGHSGSTGYPYYGPGPGGDSPYGGNNMSQSGGGYGYGDPSTQYPPAAHHHGDNTPPAYDWSRRPQYSSTTTATAGHKDGNTAHEAHNAPFSSGGPSAGHS